MNIITGHAKFDENGKPRHGTGFELTTYFDKRKKSYYHIRHSLFVGNKTEVEKSTQFKKDTFNLGYKYLPFLLRCFQEQVINFYYIFKSRPVELYIGIDPLNGFSGVIANKLGFITHSIFYTADYAYERFNNRILNFVYHKIDMFVAKNSAQVWNVSSRIVEERIRQGIPRDKVYLVPNTPDRSKIKIKPLSQINRYDIAIVGNITRALNITIIIDEIKQLSGKYPKIRLLIIGSGEYEKDLIKYVRGLRLQKHIKFLGSLGHNDVLKILSDSAVGVAIYTDNDPWTRFGDSMKVREYMACGLPIILNDIPSTADDVKKEMVGFVLKNEKDVGKKIDKLLSDNKTYKIMRANAIRLSKRYDFYKVVSEALHNL